jgi:hypothetical protein
MHVWINISLNAQTSTRLCAAQVGADEKLSSVIDGESLVNDGSALVIFLVLQQFVQGASLTATEVSRKARGLACACAHPNTFPIPKQCLTNYILLNQAQT